ncbi:tRNA (adenosine(37)-N6)-dimethylallyltransferase MiaA [Aquimarina aquimarini]|uniref:tRNA (adenosine(37)-N6)-dimethylallyltransferase MiaA n=1 Tax=Aquimarina aquimarini TaxID=1191734 RepID=UPI000D558ED0|nr:tRNA (adenosine(37)-N6)-dimethylallyltransferase MiaA [Aquimarina aquimarini]
MNKNLIVITGPTGIGKTNLSIRLAQHFDCEIVSADSRQFYREMYIGTAAPSPEELAQAQHHFIQHISIHDEYSVGDFEKDALNKIDELFKIKDYAILIGGSGLYIDALTKGLDHFPEIDIEVRKKIQEKYDSLGIEVLQQELKLLDPVYYDKVDLQNTHRVMRALEVCIGSGQPYSSFLSKPKKKRPFNIIKIGITATREIIYDRINQRVDIMVENGLLDEVTELYPYKHLNALNTVGYKEIFKYLDKEWDVNFAISEIKKNTRRFAKRQLTWFKKDTETKWFDYIDPIEKISTYIERSSL